MLSVAPVRLHLLVLVAVAGCAVEIAQPESSPEPTAADGPAPLAEVVGLPGEPTWQARHTEGACGWDLDVGRDGTTDQRAQIELDPAGLRIERQDEDADGTWDLLLRDMPGRDDTVARREVEAPLGELASVSRYRSDALGRRVEEGWDFAYVSPGEVGDAEYVWRSSWDAEGRLAAILFVNQETSTPLVSLTSFAYDPDGLGFQVVYDADGPLQRTERWRLALDDAGRLATVEQDFEADGVVDARWSYAYDARGRRVRQVAQIGDGDRIFRYGLDAQDRLVTIDYDHDAPDDGPARWTYHYDCASDPG